MKKIFYALLLTAAVLGGITAYADISDYTVENKDGHFLISGTLDKATEAEGVVLSVLKAGKSFENALSKDDIGFLKQADVEKNVGKFSFVYPYPAQSGVYNARFNGINFTKPQDFKLKYVLPEDAENALGELKKNLDSEETFKAFLETGSNAMYLGCDEVPDNVEYTDAEKIAYRFIKDKITTVKDAAEIKSIWNTAVLTVLINDKKVSDIADYEEYLSFSDSRIAKWYAHIKSQSGATKKLTDLLGGGYTSENDVLKAFGEGLILTVVRYPDGVKNIGYVLVDFNDLSGKTSSGETEKYTKVAGKDYDNFEEFMKYFNSLKSSSGNGGGSSSGGSSGGGKGSGSSGAWANTPLAGATGTKQEIKLKFLDLDTVPWASEAITALFDKKIINGKTEERFAPNDFITREEFVKLLICAAELEKESYGRHFGDSAESDWFDSYVNIAYEKGLCKGTGDGVFGVGQQISRQDMAVILCGFMRYKGAALNTTEAAFADSDRIDGYAKEAVAALVNAGCINGVGDNMFDPQGNATRAQAAKVLYDVLKATEGI